MKALIDADILRYEIGFASQTGWKAITDRDEIPPFNYVQDMLHQRIDQILLVTGADDYSLFLTEGRTFRYDLAKRRPYKGTRTANKPWHFDNLSVYIRDVLPSTIVTEIEADDAMAIEQCTTDYETVICSRDKDLWQVPGLFYSWEIGNQASIGPKYNDEVGEVRLSDTRKKIYGDGFAYFCSQLFTGDVVDNIPGLPKYGPVKVAALLEAEDDPKFLMATVEEEYEKVYGDEWEEELLEQGRLLWIVRKLDEHGNPVLWERGMYK